MNVCDISMQNARDSAAAKVLIKMRVISKLCDELAHDENTPEYFRTCCNETFRSFRNNAHYYARIKELAPDTKAISIHHFEEAYRHIELATKGVGAGFTTKLMKGLSRHVENVLEKIIARSRKKAQRMERKCKFAK